MKTSLFIANVVSAILLVNFLLINPSITGFAVSQAKPNIDVAGPLGFALFFIITIIVLDIYFYLKTKRQ